MNCLGILLVGAAVLASLFFRPAPIWLGVAVLDLAWRTASRESWRYLRRTAGASMFKLPLWVLALAIAGVAHLLTPKPAAPPAPTPTPQAETPTPPDFKAEDTGKVPNFHWASMHYPYQGDNPYLRGPVLIVHSGERVSSMNRQLPAALRPLRPEDVRTLVLLEDVRGTKEDAKRYWVLSVSIADLTVPRLVSRSVLRVEQGDYSFAPILRYLLGLRRIPADGVAPEPSAKARPVATPPPPKAGAPRLTRELEFWRYLDQGSGWVDPSEPQHRGSTERLGLKVMASLSWTSKQRRVEGFVENASDQTVYRVVVRVRDRDKTSSSKVIEVLKPGAKWSFDFPVTSRHYDASVAYRVTRP